MKKIIYLVLIVAVIGAIYFFGYRKNKVNLIYKEPTTSFFDKSQVSPNDAQVKITPDGFVPNTITIKSGQKVVWVNETSGYSWPASNPHPTHTLYPGFDPELPLKSNQAWSFTFNKVGSWGYHDHLDPTVRGTVIVTE